MCQHWPGTESLWISSNGCARTCRGDHEAHSTVAVVYDRRNIATSFGAHRAAMKTIYFVAGEASADNHGAALMRALRSTNRDLGFIGRGGPQMKALAGANFRNWIDKSGVLGLWEVIKHYGYFRKKFHEALGEIETSKPDAVVLMDYPGFNLRLARTLRK